MVRISKKFIKSSIIYTVAGALPMASAIILLPFYGNNLPLAVYGELATYIAFSMLVQVLVTYSFDTSVYVYYHEYKNSPEKLSQFLSSAFISILGIGFVSVIIFSLAGSLIFDSVFSQKGISFFPYGLASVVTAVFQACFKVHSSVLQSSEKPVLFFWSNLLSFSLIALFTVIGLLLYPATLIGPVGGRLLAAVISGSWVLIRVFRLYGITFNYSLLKKSFTYNNSSYVYQLQQWVVNYFDRMLITLFLTLEAAGSYDFAWKCLLVIDFIVAGLFNSFYPKVIGIITAQQKKQSDPVINRYYHGLTAMIMLMICLCILGFPLITAWGIVKPEYGKALPYVPFLALGYLIRAMRYYFNSPYGALKYVAPLPVIYLFVSGLKIGLILLFIREFELYSIIGATLISGVVEIILLRVGIKSRFEFKYNPFKLVIAPSLLGLVIIIGEVFPVMNLHLRHIMYTGICVLILWWFYRNELKLIKPFGLLK
jgi:O-antigen/teichoic acid export membrane protein